MKGITVLAAMGLVSISCAQNVFEEPSNVAFRLGYVYPVDSTLRDLANSYIGVGLDFFPSGRPLLKGGETVISFDWFGKSGSGAKGNVFPILINNRVYQQGAEKGGRSYFQYGAGIALIDVTSSKTVLAARAGYGKELGERLFGELNFTYTDAANGARGTALGFYVGYRF